ncbi:MlaD family protein [Aeoliella sp. SH292]|uniref:MlaD family protein n=1 Tax=Aeoliella sp. SH292 TaxID=3454464 RepID=UPI003F9BC2F2
MDSNKITANDTVIGTEFPVARLEPRRVLGASRMWWATAAALAIAAFLVWRSMESHGPRITIQFPEGHGLAVGDFVRHRGIEVGHVERVDLSKDLENVEVGVTLLEGADALAREGTEFWIVRPQLSLTEVRGLETALGSKYIAVRPGALDGKRQTAFEGLPAPPAGDAYSSGLEIVLRGDQGFGLSPNAPVTWRGVDVGQVLSVDIASDSRYVDVRVRIDSSYQNLVRANSKFWVTSGLDIDAGLTGIRLRTDSLTAIARGGISFITPAKPDAYPIRAGHVFALAPKEDSDWTSDASTISLIEFPLPPTVTIRATWKQKYLGFTQTRTADVNAVLVRGDKQLRLIAPAEGVEVPESAIADSWQLAIFAPGAEGPLAELLATTKFRTLAAGMAECVVETKIPPAYSIPESKLRRAAEPEDCCLARSVGGTEGSSHVIHSLSRTSLSASSEGWRIEADDDDFDDWQGAAVVAAVDGSVLGQLIVTSAGPTVVPIPAAN